MKDAVVKNWKEKVEEESRKEKKQDEGESREKERDSGVERGILETGFTLMHLNYILETIHFFLLQIFHFVVNN